MSLILNALKRAQQIRRERQQQEQRFETNFPWFSRWSKRGITFRQFLLVLGLSITMVLFFLFYKTSMPKRPVSVSQSSSDKGVTYPIEQSPLEELKEELIEVPLEEVALLSVPAPSVAPTPSGKNAQQKSDVAAPKSPHPTEKPLDPVSKKSIKDAEKPLDHASKKSIKAIKKPSDLVRKKSIKDQVASVIPKPEIPPAKPAAPVSKKKQKGKVRIQPIPSQDAIKHFNLGLLYHKNNKPHEALGEYKKALEIDPLNVQAHNNIGMVYKDLGKLIHAKNHYQNALSINPAYGKAHHNLAVVYYLNGDFEKAILEYKLAIDCDPRNPETYNNLGLIYRKQNEIFRAKNIFHKGLSIAPDYAPIHYNLALVLEDDGDWKNAIIHFRRFIELSKGHQQNLVEKVKQHLEVLVTYEKR